MDDLDFKFFNDKDDNIAIAKMETKEIFLILFPNLTPRIL